MTEEAGFGDLLGLLLGISGASEPEGGVMGLRHLEFSGLYFACNYVQADCIGTDSYAVATGSEVDTGPFRSLAYTIAAADKDLSFEVEGANDVAFADAVVVQDPASVSAGSVGKYVISSPPFRYYRLKFKNASAGQVTTATYRGLAR